MNCYKDAPTCMNFSNPLHSSHRWRTKSGIQLLVDS